MRLTVLGKSPAWTDAGGACSGYLVEEDGTNLLVDCGSGVFSKLRRYHDYLAVDGAVISHLHADHFLDLVPYAYALVYAPRRHAVRPVLHAPPGARAAFRRVTGAWGSEDLIERAFELREYALDEVVEVGPMRLRFLPVPHYVATNAMEISSAVNGARLTYGADTAPSAELCAFAAGTDLLLIEATLTEPDEPPRGHLTPSEAGEHGARSGARRLVLTHLSDQLDEDWARAEAQRAYGRPVEVAHEGAVYTV